MVTIEYCTVWGYLPRARGLGQAITDRFGGKVAVSLKAGRRSSFEVTFDGEVIHSKLESQEWPDTGAVLEALAKRIPPW